MLIVLANLVLPGSAQVALGRPGWGVLVAAAFGWAVAGALVGEALVPGFLSTRAVGALVVVAAATWSASQAALVLALRRNEQEERTSRAQALQEVARLWLRGEGDEALALTGALLDRWPREPVMHFVAARLWAERSERDSARRAARLLARCAGCDLQGRWRSAIAREWSGLEQKPGAGG